MLRNDFYFDLPPELIAQFPSDKRGNDRLLVLDKETGHIVHAHMEDIASFVEPGTVMVFNNSRVRRARVYAAFSSPDNPQNAELLFVSRLMHTGENQPAGSRWKVMVKKAKKFRAGTVLCFEDGNRAHIAGNPEYETGEFRELVFDTPIDENWFEKYGHIPLPPYIRRDDKKTDEDRYQTVYARETGSVAAPTAGLHFTETVFERIRAAHIETYWITLHVGPGTFLPVRTNHIEDHVMHEEWYSVSEETAAAVRRAKSEGRKILAVGTTSVRTLESAYNPETGVRSGSGATHIFIYPGYRFNTADMIFTNFHTPESTLLMLVSAFAGKDRIFAAYKEAVEKKYGFFSYGDAMLIR